MTTSACEQQLHRLACALVGRRLPHDEHAAASPAEVLARAIALAHAVGDARPDLDDAALATAADLFGFLRSDAASPAASAMASFEDEPARAWDELEASWYWSFAALVENVWEHCTEPDEDTPWRGTEPGSRVLDFGAGAGVWAFALASAGARVSCYEPNAVTRAFLSWRAEVGHPALGVRVLDGPPWRDAAADDDGAPYDVILALDVLDHLADPVGAIGRLAPLVRPQGRIVIRASFPDDGWHQGGPTMRREVYRELVRCFEHHPHDAGDETFAMVRRQGTAPTEESPSDQTLYSLHPGTVIGPAPPGQPGHVLSVARFYITPMWLDEIGVALANALRRPISVHALQQAMRPLDVDDDEVLTALATLRESNLVLRRDPLP